MTASAAAETRYDRNLEKAVLDIVAGKMGNIRGGFSYKQVPQLVVLPDAGPVAPTPVEPPRKQASGNDGLMHAIERQVSRTIF
ncbi:hypothetical protein [Mesorhizobium sp. CA5]|uniref:hypothetical protein n=1 Tax=Mesorhizobium sp. CA5 TaxID=2876638 RepID=UPI001CD0A07C|nr:hypothetical protein [Mesorhizobium sp. CA5]MBZ9842611.1 hypothetical protein [Mesorhizobium sp. CA5]